MDGIVEKSLRNVSMRKHVRHLLTAYVQHQLSPALAARVASHVRECPECHTALDREMLLTRDLARYVPQIGRPRHGQLARLWPAIWHEFRTPTSNAKRWLPSYGLLMAFLLACAFFTSSLFAGPSHVIAAPVPLVPADVRPTVTPIHTDEPTVTAPEPSETARAAYEPYLPSASPAPLVNPVSWQKGR
jgi:anti-sigma factor RsiW